MPRVSAEHQAARRRQILDAAHECFARHGFHRTTMQHIVRRSKLSPGAIYGYFKGKQAIIQAIADERHASEREAFARAADLAGSKGSRVALSELVRRFLGRLESPFEQRQRKVGVQLWAEALRDRRVMRLVERGVEEPLEQLTALLDRARERGEIADTLDPQALARLLIAAFHGFVLQQAWDPGVDLGRYIDTLEAVLDGLVRANRVSSRRRPSRRS
jgi:TetR/AcrR family transcriptional regulator, transcriptional repressor of aconitase